MGIHENIAKGTSARAAPDVGAQAAFRLLQFPLNRRQRAAFASAGLTKLGGISKRTLDLVVAVAMLILLAPALATIAFLIRCESEGPALFRQQRLGLYGKPFRILKFRTMHVLEDGDHIRQAQPYDKRVTRIGRILRASSLDEVPQLVNVVRGEMSLVGPRPHAVAHDTHYGALIGHYAQRRSVKPGITGWAQINGLRGATPTVEAMRRRVDHDVWYARNASFLVDLKILLRTPLELLRQRNAY